MTVLAAALGLLPARAPGAELTPPDQSGAGVAPAATCTCSPPTPPTAPVCYVARCNCTDIVWDFVPRPAGYACNDGDACTSGDACNGSGTCLPGPNTCSPPGTPGAIAGPTGPNTTGSYAISWGAASGTVTRCELTENGALAYSGGALSASFSGKANGSYSYRVRACNSAGCGAYTAAFAVPVLRSPGAPGPIAGPSGTNATGSYTLSWGAASGTVSRYDLYQNGVLAYSGTSLSASFSGKPDGSYSYQVQACNSGSCGVFTAAFGVTVLLPPGTPGAISAPASNSTGSYAVSWGVASGTVARYDRTVPWPIAARLSRRASAPNRMAPTPTASRPATPRRAAP
jgi:hypothetical protein